MKKRNSLLAFVFILSMFSATASAMQVTIDRDNLSTPTSYYAYVAIIDDARTVTNLRSTQTLTLNDGGFQLTTQDGKEYGTFTITNDVVSAVSGAVMFDDATRTISFDTSKLARATIHFDEVDDSSNGVMFGIYGISGAIRSAINTFYLPDGDYRVGFRYAGSAFGVMHIANQTLTPDGYLMLDSNGDVRFDLSSLARVTLTRGNELGMLANINEVGGIGGIRTGAYEIHLTPGTYAVIPRGNYDPFGMIIVDENNNVSSTGLLLTDTSTNTVSYDIEHAPVLTFNWGQLSSSTPSEKNIYYAGVYENIGSANDQTASFPVDSDFYVHGPSKQAKLGDFEIDSVGNVTVSGHMVVEDAAVDENGRVHTTIGFKLCELNSVSIMPAEGKRYWYHPHFYTTDPGITYLPNGEFILYGDNGAKVVFSVDGESLSVSEDNQSHVTLTYNPSSCAPPDSDEDKVLDDMDVCTDTPLGATVDADGCSVPQSIETECSNWQTKSHGKYVRCVTRVVNRAADEGLIDNNEKGALISEAAKK